MVDDLVQLERIKASQWAGKTLFSFDGHSTTFVVTRVADF